MNEDLIYVKCDTRYKYIGNKLVKNVWRKSPPWTDWAYAGPDHVSLIS